MTLYSNLISLLSFRSSAAGMSKHSLFPQQNTGNRLMGGISFFFKIDLESGSTITGIG